MVEYTLVDVFRAPWGDGNPAAVVCAADGLSDAEMQRVAHTLGLSETAFLCYEGGLRLRWFTPTCEVAMCGHATIAAAHVLDPRGAVTFDTASGSLTVRPEVLGGEVLWWLGRAAPAITAFRGDAAPLLAALGDPPLDPELPLVVSADSDLLLPLRDHEVVAGLQPDFARLAAANRAAGLRGVAALAVPGGGDHEVRLRFFAPNVGVDEDPVTGSVHGAVVVYLHQLEVLEHWPEELRALSHQGDPHGRQGLVWLRLRIDPETNQPVTAEVGGQTVTSGSGQVL